MNSTTKTRLRGLRLWRKPQMDCANTAQSRVGTKNTAAARRRNVAGSLMPTTCARPQVWCHTSLAPGSAPRGARRPASRHDCLMAYASGRPTLYTGGAPAGTPLGRHARHAPRAAPDLQGGASLPGERGKYRRVPADALLARSVKGAEHERRAHGRDHHA